MTECFLHCISAALKEKKKRFLSDVKNTDEAKIQSRMFKKWRVLLKLCYVPFFHPSYVQVFSTNFLHRVTGSNHQNEVENVRKNSQKRWRNKNTRKE